MGIGDEIMVSGEARVLVQGTGRRVAVWDGRPGKACQRWHAIWEGNPRIARPGEPFDVRLYNHPNNRPYIVSKTSRQWTWREYAPPLGELFFSPQETKLMENGRGRVILYPFIKTGSSPNKQWPLQYWQELVDAAPRLNWLQIGEGNEPKLSGIDFLQTETFRDACAVLAGSRGAVLHEGGLHHAAAALGIPAVVVFGGFISPRVTGYAGQSSLFVESPQHPLGCGMRVPCFHCHRAMHSIRPHKVLSHLKELLECETR